VHLALRGEDADLLTGEEFWIRDTHQFRDTADCAVPALVAKDRRDIVVVQHGIAEHVANEPLVRIERHLSREPLVERFGGCRDLRQVEL
jgi:hypothetical protein